MTSYRKGFVCWSCYSYGQYRPATWSIVRTLVTIVQCGCSVRTIALEVLGRVTSTSYPAFLKSSNRRNRGDAKDHEIVSDPGGALYLNIVNNPAHQSLSSLDYYPKYLTISNWASKLFRMMDLTTSMTEDVSNAIKRCVGESAIRRIHFGRALFQDSCRCWESIVLQRIQELMYCKGLTVWIVTSPQLSE